jgi:hypothetical protein
MDITMRVSATLLAAVLAQLAGCVTRPPVGAVIPCWENVPTGVWLTSDWHGGPEPKVMTPENIRGHLWCTVHPD